MASRFEIEDTREDREEYRKTIRKQFATLDQLRERVFEVGNVFDLAALYAILDAAVIDTKQITFPWDPEKLEPPKRMVNSPLN